MGRDAQPGERSWLCADFNPRAPCGARLRLAKHYEAGAKFQSTRPVWGATAADTNADFLFRISIHAPRVGRDCSRLSEYPLCSHFNPRAPCGARPAVLPPSVKSVLISIHAPRVGRDCRYGRQTVRRAIFQSTRPVWGATLAFVFYPSEIPYFNPRAPCGARLFISNFAVFHVYFNPRAPCGARPDCHRPQRLRMHFNPRAPCGARPAFRSLSIRSCSFQSTRPVWGATIVRRFVTLVDFNFNPRAPCGARRDR